MNRREGKHQERFNILDFAFGNKDNPSKINERDNSSDCLFYGKSENDGTFSVLYEDELERLSDDCNFKMKDTLPESNEENKHKESYEKDIYEEFNEESNEKSNEESYEESYEEYYEKSYEKSNEKSKIMNKESKDSRKESKNIEVKTQKKSRRKN